MIVRVTLPSIDRFLRWGALATASLFVGAAGFAAICICVFATTPMYDINCPDYECRPAARDLRSTAVVVKRDRSELPPRAWTSAPSPAIEPVRDGACNLGASQHFADVFRHESVALQQRPVRRRPHVLPRGVYFSTDRNCGEMCNLQVWEAPFDARHSEHWLVSPDRIAIDANDEFIAWGYYNDDEWFVRVLDRETHDIVLDDRGSDAAIIHFRLVDGLLALEVLENGTAMHNKPAKRRVYQLSTPAPSSD